MRLPFAKDGLRFLIPLGLLTALFAWLSWTIAALIAGGFFLFVLNFFRDPERPIPDDPKAVVSPADGKVVEIVSEGDPALDGPFTRVSIFLNVFNVHVNRVPIAGTIETVRYNKGKFLAAFNHKASLDNEQNAILVSNGSAKILVKQIAGLIARRIVCWAQKGDTYRTGQRFGLIRFGSRVDIFVPETTRLAVKNGDIVKGGSSVIGYLQ